MKLDSASGENYTNDTWTNHNIYIAVNNGNDANSGHQSTTYSISGPITVTNSSEARTLTAEGTYTVVLTTKDMAGNTATRTYTIKLMFPHIGDYVSYKPDTPSIGYSLSTDYSGYDKNQIIDTNYDPTEWRIMELDSNRNITKLFGVPSSNQGKIYFKNATGYNNSVYLLNDICKNRYSNVILGATARSLNLEDIESRMNSRGIETRNKYKSGTVQYGTTKKYTDSYAKYPAIYAQEKYSGVGIGDVADGTQIITGNIDNISLKKMNPNGKSESNNIYETLPTISESLGTSVKSLTCTQTFYHTAQLSSYYNDLNFYNMIFETGAHFWIASRYVDNDSNFLGEYFGLRVVYEQSLSGILLVLFLQRL